MQPKVFYINDHYFEIFRTGRGNCGIQAEYPALVANYVTMDSNGRNRYKVAALPDRNNNSREAIGIISRAI